MSDETTIWEGSPSQVLNLPAFIVCGLLVGILLGAAVLVRTQFGPIVPIALASAAILPILYALWRFVKNNSRHYTVTTERIRIREGILSKTTNEVEFYRVRDYVLVEPLSMRFFGLADLVLTTDDQINPTVTFNAIPDATKARGPNPPARRSLPGQKARAGDRMGQPTAAGLVIDDHHPVAVPRQGPHLLR